MKLMYSFWWRYESRWRPTRVKGTSVWTYAKDSSTAGHPFAARQFTVVPVPLDLNQTVILANETFDWINSDITPWNETETEYPPTDDEVTRTIILDGVQLATGPSKLGWRWSVNDVIDREDFYATPYLVGLYSKPENLRGYDYDTINANGGYDNVTNSYVAQKGEVLDIVIQNRAGETTGVAEAHPWHSHGNKYWDMGQGKDEFNYDKVREYREAAKGKPFLRDTSVAYPAPGASYLEDKLSIFDHAGWRLFRIRVENPGVWLIHCHILPHAVMVCLPSIFPATRSLTGRVCRPSSCTHRKTCRPSQIACTKSTPLSEVEQVLRRPIIRITSPRATGQQCKRGLPSSSRELLSGLRGDWQSSIWLDRGGLGRARTIVNGRD